jgi:hypothetical protein
MFVAVGSVAVIVRGGVVKSPRKTAPGKSKFPRNLVLSGEADRALQATAKQKTHESRSDVRPF